jgi:hypothetical protein
MLIARTRQAFTSVQPMPGLNSSELDSLAAAKTSVSNGEAFGIWRSASSVFRSASSHRTASLVGATAHQPAPVEAPEVRRRTRAARGRSLSIEAIETLT